MYINICLELGGNTLLFKSSLRSYSCQSRDTSCLSSELSLRLGLKAGFNELRLKLKLLNHVLRMIIKVYWCNWLTFFQYLKKYKFRWFRWFDWLINWSGWYGWFDWLIDQVEMDGLTGKVSFDAAGFRSNFNLEIVELRKEGLTKVQN